MNTEWVYAHMLYEHVHACSLDAFMPQALVCAHAFKMDICTHACIYVCKHAYVHTCIQAYMHTCMGA